MWGGLRSSEGTRRDSKTLLTLGPFALGFSSCRQAPALSSPLFPQLIQFKSIQFNKHLLNVSCQIPFPSFSWRLSSFSFPAHSPIYHSPHSGPLGVSWGIPGSAAPMNKVWRACPDLPVTGVGDHHLHGLFPRSIGGDSLEWSRRGSWGLPISCPLQAYPGSPTLSTLSLSSSLKACFAFSRLLQLRPDLSGSGFDSSSSCCGG